MTDLLLGIVIKWLFSKKKLEIREKKKYLLGFWIREIVLGLRCKQLLDKARKIRSALRCTDS